MHRVATIVALVFAVLITAGCDPVQERRYFREGIGTSLYTDALPEAARLQDLYVALICREAGLAPIKTALSSYASAGVTAEVILESRCDQTTNLTAQDWAEFVKAGMNDIDQRCDAYLAWLDDKRRTREPILKQIFSTAVATDAILRLTSVGANPIGIVGIAFGLAADTFTNVRSRLLIEVNHTTVQSVVVHGQNRYRKEIKWGDIDGRPTAIHALRSYLRICMPFTIETEINSLVTIYERSGPNGLANKKPLADPSTVVPINARQVLPVPPPPRNKIAGAMTVFEENIPALEGSLIQKAFKVKPANSDFGPQGSDTRNAIIEFKKARNRSATIGINTETNTVFKTSQTFEGNPDGVIRSAPDLSAMLDVASTVRKCEGTFDPISTPYELGVLSRMKSNVFKMVRAALKANDMAITFDEPKGKDRCALSTSFRGAILALNQKLNTGAAEPKALNDKLLDKISGGHLLW